MGFTGGRGARFGAWFLTKKIRARGGQDNAIQISITVYSKHIYYGLGRYFFLNIKGLCYF